MTSEAIQEEYAGEGSVSGLGDLIRHRGVRRAFLVTGTHSFALSGAEAAIAPALSGVRVKRFCDFERSPTLADVERGIEIYRSWEPDAVIAIGGGSVIDMAKLIAGCAPQHCHPYDLVIGRRALERDVKLQIVIPTTAGSGSEATHFAVVYVDGKKYSLADDRLRPGVVFLDPVLTHSLPPAWTACSGMDVLAQGVESFWSARSTTQSRSFAREAIKLALANLEGAVQHPDEINRMQMLRAANLAGKAIDITTTTACHALSYALTARWGVPHGHAVGLTLGAMCVYNAGVTKADVIDARGADHVRRVMKEIIWFFGQTSAAGVQGRVSTLMQSIGLATRLRDLEICHDDDLQYIVTAVDTARLSNNPRKLDTAALRKIVWSVR